MYLFLSGEKRERRRPRFPKGVPGKSGRAFISIGMRLESWNFSIEERRKVGAPNLEENQHEFAFQDGKEKTELSRIRKERERREPP